MQEVDLDRLLLKVAQITKNVKRDDSYRALKEIETLRKMILSIKRNLT